MTKSCANCIYLRGCMWNSEYTPSPCAVFEDKANYRHASEVKADTIRELQTELAMHFGTYCGTDTIAVHDVFAIVDKVGTKMLETTECE